MNVGFIGLGIMGRPMAEHLAAGGHTMFLHSRSGVPEGMSGTKCASPREVAEKVKEEIAELEREVGNGKQERLEDELGDLLFAVVNLARKLAIDPRAALERANDKFTRRFEALLQRQHVWLAKHLHHVGRLGGQSAPRGFRGLKPRFRAEALEDLRRLEQPGSRQVRGDALLLDLVEAEPGADHLAEERRRRQLGG